MNRKLTVSEAARELNTTEAAIRQRVNRGTIKHERDDQGHVFIIVEADNRNHTEDNPTDTRQLIETLQEQLRQEREANRENRRLLAAALERIPAIEAPAERDGPETATDGESRGVGRPDDTDEPRRSSWWQRWFGANHA